MADTVARAQGPVTDGPQDLVEAAGMPVGSGVIKPGYDPRLTNEDLAPLRNQSWGSYNIFAFWMSDVHSVGGYVTAGTGPGQLHHRPERRPRPGRARRRRHR
ncbi:hypothetical protein, partial [Dactylosporangium sp. NPDC050588]|uniref:hypothetical protein n=1 Tax=Dactylosporangium sp. NPDC050588 TaxID=3157211 RepID=UPI0033C28391